MAPSLIFLIGLSLVAHVFPHVGADEPQNEANTHGGDKIINSQICETSICHEAADRITSSMNKSVDRCVDFYEYACGNWSANHPTPNYMIESNWNDDAYVLTYIQSLLRDELEAEPSAEDILPIQQLKKFYKSCMDNETRASEGLEPIMKKIRETNGWPMIMSNGTWNKDAMTWQEIAYYYENLFGVHPFYTLFTGSIQLGYHDLRIWHGPIGMVVFPDNRAVYLSIMNSVIPLFVKESGATILDEQLKKDIEDMIKFENALFEAVQREDVDTEYYTNISSFTEWLNDYAPSNVSQAKIDWEAILQRSLNITNLPMTERTAFKILGVNFFKDLVKILESTDQRTIVNYIQWLFVLNLSEYASIADKIRPILQIAYGYQNVRPRWIDCTEELKKDPVTFYLFGRKYFPSSTKTTLETMMRNFENSLGLEATNSSWLSFEKLKKVKKIADLDNIERIYPEWYDNETAIIDNYKDLKISNSYVENELNLSRIRWLNGIKRWGESSRTEFEDLPTTNVGSFGYNIFDQKIADFLPPRFDKRLPEYVTYGSVASKIVSKLAVYLRMLPSEIKELVLTNDTLSSRRELGKCLIKLFDEYSQGSGRRGLYDNLAEHRGIQGAFYNYKGLKNTKYPNGELKLPGFDTFTDEQMFFLSYAQTKCSASPEKEGYESSAAKHKVLGHLSSSSAFNEAFKCAINTPMNRAEKCDARINSNIAA